MNPANSNRPAGTGLEPKFGIGQDVHLKTGGPDMIVNQCTQAPEGGFIVDTIWFGAGRAEERGTYQEEELEARVRAGKIKR
jgi:uncharacterized protein YodC (DUF2158 family)